MYPQDATLEIRDLVARVLLQHQGLAQANVRNYEAKHTVDLVKIDVSYPRVSLWADC